MFSVYGICFAIYLIAMIGIGIYFYRKTTSLSDYFLGGRTLSAPVAALSAGASDMSGWLLLGLPGAIYVSGLSEIWIAFGLTLGAYANWRFVAPKLRSMTEELGNAITIPAYLENRFADHSHFLKLASALVILIFFTIYTASGLVAGAVLFEKTFNLDYNHALYLGALLIVSYTFLGGFHAVSWTDLVQGILMMIALIVLPVVALNHLGGWEQATQAIGADKASITENLTVLGFISLMGWGLGYVGQPHILVRFMSIRSVSEVPLARRIGISWMVISLIGAIFCGYLGIAVFGANPLSNPETVFITLAKNLLSPGIAGFLLAAVLAAVMSTVDSQLLVCSSSFTEDFYKVVLRKNASNKELVWVGRLTVVAVALLAMSIAANRESGIFSLVTYAWAGFGGAFGPVIVLSLYWKNMSKESAMAGLITGTATVLIWKNLSGGIFELYEIIPAFLLNMSVIYIVNKLQRR